MDGKYHFYEYNTLHEYIAATINCYLGEELDTNVTVSKSIIITEGSYLLKDAAIPCSGKIASIELCGVFINSDSTAKFTKLYLNASLYQPHLTNEANSWERITDPVRLESGSSATVNGVTCARLSVVDYNWTALEGDILGVSFINSSCEVRTSKTHTSQTCPVYAAVQTNSSSDVVYYSENNSVTSLQLDELSNITGVKINLQAFVGECC